MNEDDPKLAEFRHWLDQNIGSIVAKYSGRVLWVLTTFAFAAGCWATKIQLDIGAIKDAQVEARKSAEAIRESMDAANTATAVRVVDWSKWRVLKDSVDDNYERRLAWIEAIERTRDRP